MALVDLEMDGKVALLTINRPDKLNALDGELLATLGQKIASLRTGAAEDHVRAAVLTGAGRAFVAGADIAAMADMTPPQARCFSELGHEVLASIELAQFPVIAAVNGFALGGGLELALACDFIYAADTAKLGQPEVSLAVIPGFGGTQRLTRRVGIARARELIYTGRIILAAEAARIGLANEVVPAADLLPRVRAVAAEIAAVGPLAVGAAKRVMHHGQNTSLADACALEVQAFAALFGSDDQRAGMRAFLAKQKTEFKGS